MKELQFGAIIRVIELPGQLLSGFALDIAAHLALHNSAIRAWVYKNVGRRGNFREDAYQNIVEALIEAHEKGWYDHSCELLTYLWPYLRGIAFRGIDPEYRYGGKEELDMLEEMAEKAHGRYMKVEQVDVGEDEKGEIEEYGERVHLDPLYDSPIPGLKTPLESTLTPEEQAQAEKLLANLTDEDREILEASYGRKDREAAAFLGMPKSTYQYRLKRARERAEVLLRLLH